MVVLQVYTLASSAATFIIVKVLSARDIVPVGVTISNMVGLPSTKRGLRSGMLVTSNPLSCQLMVGAGSPVAAQENTASYVTFTTMRSPGIGEIIIGRTKGKRVVEGVEECREWLSTDP